MRTFLEAIEQKKTDKIAYECFVLMGEKGIHPMKYVTWLHESGLKNPNLLSESHDWLDLEIDIINEGGLAHTLGWAAGSLPRWGAQAAGKVLGWGADQAGSFMQGGTQGFGQGIDQAMGRDGIQASPVSPTGHYDTETGHYVKWKGDGEPDPKQKDGWETVDHKGNPIPPNSPPPQPPQNGGPQNGGPQNGGPQSQPQAPQNPIEQAAHQAVGALQDVLKRAGRQGSKLSQANMQQVLMSLITALQDKANFAADEPQQQPPGAKPPVMDMSKLGQPQQTWNRPIGNVIQEKSIFANVLHKKLVEIRVRDVCNKFADLQIDPRMFAEWYINEGIHCETEEQFNEDFGQWLGGLGNAVKGAWNAGVDSFKNKPLGSMWDSIKGGWQQGWSDNDEQYDQKSVQAAIAALKPLVGKAPKLDQQIQAVSQQLQGFLGGGNNAPANNAPANNAPANNAPANNAPAKGLEDINNTNPNDPKNKNPQAQTDPTVDPAVQADPAVQVDPVAQADPAAPAKESPRDVAVEKQAAEQSNGDVDGFIELSKKSKGTTAAGKLARNWDKLTPEAKAEFSKVIQQHLIASKDKKIGLGSNKAYQELAKKHFAQPTAPDVSQQPDVSQPASMPNAPEDAEAKYQAYKAQRKSQKVPVDYGDEDMYAQHFGREEVEGEPALTEDDKFFKSILGGKKKSTWFS